MKRGMCHCLARHMPMDRFYKQALSRLNQASLRPLHVPSVPDMAGRCVPDEFDLRDGPR